MTLKRDHDVIDDEVYDNAVDDVDDNVDDEADDRNNHHYGSLYLDLRLDYLNKTTGSRSFGTKPPGQDLMKITKL